MQTKHCCNHIAHVCMCTYMHNETNLLRNIIQQVHRKCTLGEMFVFQFLYQTNLLIPFYTNFQKCHCLCTYAVTHLLMIVCFGKCVLRQLCHCVNFIECTNTNLDSINFYTSRLYYNLMGLDTHTGHPSQNVFMQHLTAYTYVHTREHSKICTSMRV